MSQHEKVYYRGTVSLSAGLREKGNRYPGAIIIDHSGKNIFYRFCPSTVRPAWMGGFLATCVFHGEVRKIEVSSYGGFFYDQESKTYFQLTAENKDEWFTYLNDCLSAIE